MSDLEVAAKPYILPLVTGRGTRIAGAAARTISTWAVKTALMSGSRFDPPIREHFYRDFYEARLPSARTRLWLGGFPHLPVHTNDWRPMTFYGEDEEIPECNNGYQAVMSVGHLAMWVVAWTDRKPNFAPAFDGFEDALIKLWPLDGRPVQWPPRAALTMRGLDDLAEALGTFRGNAEEER